MQKSRRVSMDFTLRWQSDYALHTDRVHLEKVDFWRDLFPERLAGKVPEQSVGDTVCETFEPGTLTPPFSEKRIIRFPENLFQLPGSVNNDVPIIGRFYPKGCAWKPLESFPEDLTPVRIIATGEEGIVADCNHPLSRFPLELEAAIVDEHASAAQRGGSLNDIGEQVVADGPGMQIHLPLQLDTLRQSLPFTREHDDDAEFYREPRLVHHLDQKARELVKEYYGTILTPGSRILDLMSSWESHLPDTLELAHVEGLGMNEKELLANERLTGRRVHDVNLNPILPYPDDSFDTAICTVSIEYACRPLELMQELARVVRAQGQVAMVISERWFPGKQICWWQDLHPFERLGQVLGYFLLCNAFTDLQTLSVRGYPRPSDDTHRNVTDRSDPLYMIQGTVRK